MENNIITIENINYIVQMGVAIVILWYTYETRKLRVTSEKQLNEQRRINELSLLPYFSYGINIFQSNDNDKTAIKYFKKNTYLPPSIRNEYIQLLEKNTKIFQIKIENQSSALALDIQAVIYDGYTRNYIFGETGVVSSKLGECQYIYTARDSYQTRNEIIEDLKSHYGDNAFLNQQLIINDSEKNRYFMYIFGKTIGNRLFVFNREFEIKDGGIDLKKSNWTLEI
ncbi:MAG: hypothetical protein M0P43_00660 [Arcobacteraceae bacterium]|nr:hypothetical protein [Arcobacteraceae bacterium]